MHCKMRSAGVIVGIQNFQLVYLEYSTARGGGAAAASVLSGLPTDFRYVQCGIRSIPRNTSKDGNERHDQYAHRILLRFFYLGSSLYIHTLFMREGTCGSRVSVVFMELPLGKHGGGRISAPVMALKRK